VLARPYAWHIQQNSSSTLGHLTKDVDQVFQIIEALLNFTVNLVIVIFLLAGLISIAPATMLIVGSLLAAFYIFTYCITQRDLKRQGARLSNSYQRSLQVAQEALGGIRDIILDHTLHYFIEEYKRNTLEYRGAMARINIYSQIPRFLIEGFAIILIASIALAFTLAGSSINSILPVLGTLVLGSYRLLQPLQQCFNSVGIFQANKASLAFITDYLSAEPFAIYSQQNKSADPSLLESPRKCSLIEARNISFRYKEGKPWVLRSLNLAINQGDRIAFVGSTGSGKTTICDILLGLLKPTDGKILIEGLDLHASQESQSLWRDRVAHVPQSIYLVDGSFVENIAFGLPPEEVDIDLVVQSAEAAHIADFIKQTSHGYDTVVGERGARLSGGQRQRIGITRALYKQAKFLVLDEATSALDNRTEADVMSTIGSLGSDYTVIAIAHRLTTLRGFGRIFLLENGSIKAEGTYEDMMSGAKGFESVISTS